MELLPCPFCGAGTTRVVMNGQTWTGTKYSDPISVSVVHHCDPIEGQPSRQIERIGRDAESAIAAWNRRASPASVPAVTDGMALAFHRALTDGSIGQPEVDEIKTGLRAALAAAPTPPVSENRKDAERYRVLKSGDFSVEKFVSSSYGWKFVPMEELDAAIDAAMQEDKP